MKKILNVIVLLLILCGCNSVNKTDDSFTLNYQLQDIDFSDDAQTYLEYIGKNFVNALNKADSTENIREWIITELTNAGYSDNQISLQDINFCEGKNIILEIQGTNANDDKTIVVGAHYDGEGVGDNGSGTALLLSTAVNLKNFELPYTTYFVFFDEEESGLYGSKQFVYDLSQEQRESILYFINIDAIAFGDYCNIYGGKQDSSSKEIYQTEVYEYSLKLAKALGFNVYDTEYLDGYYTKNEKGPDLDPIGVFTNPWTLENPAPEGFNDERLYAYSPSTIPFSDQRYFVEEDIPYVYFEATNWFAYSPNHRGRNYSGYSDVGDVTLGDNGWIMNTIYDNLNYLNNNFPGRSLEHFKLYSPILCELILQPLVEEE